MATKIMVKEIRVTKRGELNFFQVGLPRDIARITGVQASISGISGLLEIHDRYLAGVIKLQAESAADLCLTAEVSIGQGGLQKSIVGFNTGNSGLLQLFTAPDADSGLHRLCIRNSYTLYGCYEEMLMKKVNASLPYTIRLFIWAETDEPVNPAKP
jgi:hypothetical protein